MQKDSLSTTAVLMYCRHDGAIDRRRNKSGQLLIPPTYPLYNLPMEVVHSDVWATSSLVPIRNVEAPRRRKQHPTVAFLKGLSRCVWEFTRDISFYSRAHFLKGKNVFITLKKLELI
ncbi:hypothetical protein OUZ56_024733 [Daphnia magna]|uniref:Uncharacterized protein n=1 Tax=Daphnia magna TaxID=35525 RepID=A0ABQ9ZHW1_9CRUS|nr:hypothetical protein OUZ56_024733 [Daphnia magna]